MVFLKLAVSDVYTQLNIISMFDTWIKFCQVIWFVVIAIGYGGGVPSPDENVFLGTSATISLTKEEENPLPPKPHLCCFDLHHYQTGLNRPTCYSANSIARAPKAQDLAAVLDIKLRQNYVYTL